MRRGYADVMAVGDVPRATAGPARVQAVRGQYEAICGKQGGSVKTYPKMNQMIVGILHTHGTSAALYAAARIEELEQQAEELEAAKRALERSGIGGIHAEFESLADAIEQLTGYVKERDWRATHES